jgi:hypothetical protein
MKRINGCFLIFFCGASFCDAQQAISSAGGEITATGGTASFTVGQIDYISFTGNSGSVLQGVQQPFEIMVVTGIVPHNEITLEYMVYPNPAGDFLTLRIQRDRIENLNYLLLEMNGKIIEAQDIEKIETSISLQGYQPATYILKVFDGTKEIKTLKIVKSNQP